MFAVFETELLGIDGVKSDPVPILKAPPKLKPTPTPEPTPTPAPAAAEPTPEDEDDTVNADDEEAPPELPSGRPVSIDDDAKPVDEAAGNVSPMDKDKGSGECNLLGDFALLVQGLLGLLAVSSLAFKRWRESPRRPMKIWFFDVSKQVFGSVLLHLANILMSMLSSGSFDVASNTVAAATDEKGDAPNPCSFYLLNLAIDVSLHCYRYRNL